MRRQHRHEVTYPALWRAVEGAVRDAATAHPDIQIPDKRRSSIVKRAVGQVLALNGVRAAKAAETARGAPCYSTASGAYFESVKGLADRGGQPRTRRSRRRVKGMFPWPPDALGQQGRSLLRLFIRMQKTRFIGFHRGPKGIIFVELRRPGGPTPTASSGEKETTHEAE